MVRLADRLPEFPWDVLAPFGDIARAHPDGIVDLSVGTPVDPTPELIQRALCAAADAPGYPTTSGPADLRAACSGWMKRVLKVDLAADAVMPVIGSKEFVAALPGLLDLQRGSKVVFPQVAYPTYAVGAVLAGVEPVASDEPEGVDGAALVWLNSPANPTGSVLPAARMAEIVAWARSAGAVVASDECYIELAWDKEPVSVLHPDVCGGSHDGILALHSLSKRSNLAGYRFGFVGGDLALVNDLLALRKHAGMMTPTPVQRAAVVAWSDDEHVATQRERYRRRREVLLGAVTASGFRVDESHAGLYLWLTRGEPCWETVRWFAERGILVTPGDFYGPAGERHVRMALTGTDEAIDGVPGRLA